MIEVVTPVWNGKEIIASPVKGTVAEIKTATGESVYEQQPLLTILLENGALKEIVSGMDGLVNRLNIQSGDKIVRGEVLVFLEADENIKHAEKGVNTH
jgi:acetyl/propionyl-CoA carboxylase alpha subunit